MLCNNGPFQLINIGQRYAKKLEDGHGRKTTLCFSMLFQILFPNILLLCQCLYSWWLAYLSNKTGTWKIINLTFSAHFQIYWLDTESPHYFTSSHWPLTLLYLFPYNNNWQKMLNHKWKYNQKVLDLVMCESIPLFKRSIDGWKIGHIWKSKRRKKCFNIDLAVNIKIYRSQKYTVHCYGTIKSYQWFIFKAGQWLF